MIPNSDWEKSSTVWGCKCENGVQQGHWGGSAGKDACYPPWHLSLIHGNTHRKGELTPTSCFLPSKHTHTNTHTHTHQHEQGLMIWRKAPWKGIKAHSQISYRLLKKNHSPRGVYSLPTRYWLLFLLVLIIKTSFCVGMWFLWRLFRVLREHDCCWA